MRLRIVISLVILIESYLVTLTPRLHPRTMQPARLYSGAKSLSMIITGAKMRCAYSNDRLLLGTIIGEPSHKIRRLQFLPERRTAASTRAFLATRTRQKRFRYPQRESLCSSQCG